MRSLFAHVRRVVRGFGPVTVYAQKTRIVFQGRVRFAGVVVRRNWLEVSFWLTRRAWHPTLRRVDQPMPGCYIHGCRVASAADLDAALIGCLRDAYAIGQQEHLGGRGRH